MVFRNLDVSALQSYFGAILDIMSVISQIFRKLIGLIRSSVSWILRATYFTCTLRRKLILMVYSCSNEVISSDFTSVVGSGDLFVIRLAIYSVLYSCLGPSIRHELNVRIFHSM